MRISDCSSDVCAPELAIVATVAVRYLITHTRRGRAMRAVFQQKEAAALVGIPISQTYRFTFALRTTLAALSGILLGAVFVVHPTAAELATLKAFVVDRKSTRLNSSH